MSSELRYNVVSREWVVVAGSRGLRPRDLPSPCASTALAPPPQHSPTCPFCPGNEERSGEETFRMDGPEGWELRVLRNKYPVVEPATPAQRIRDGSRRSVAGHGVHEVVVEHRRHDLCLSTMDRAHVLAVLGTYRARYRALLAVPGVEAIIVFRNHGPAAGTSLQHPHGQIVGLPVVPPRTRSRIEDAVRFLDETGCCLMCDVLGREIGEEVRMVELTEKFVAFVPWAALSPYHLWVAPRFHRASFGACTDDELDDLAGIFQRVLARLRLALGDPSWNLTVNSLPVRERTGDYFHWYFSLIARVTETAGFELGSGMYVNPLPPEQAAAVLRGVLLP